MNGERIAQLLQARSFKTMVNNIDTTNFILISIYIICYLSAMYTLKSV